MGMAEAVDEQESLPQSDLRKNPALERVIELEVKCMFAEMGLER